MSEQIFYPFGSIDGLKNATYNLKKSRDRTIDIHGTVKIHGTNAGVVVTREGSVYAQSKNRILSIDSDNHGFAAWLETKTELFSSQDVKNGFLCNPDVEAVVFYGEWCGGNIQNKVGMTGADKHFVVFSCQTIVGDGSRSHFGFGMVPDHPNIHKITDFKQYSMTINPHDPQSYEQIMALVDEVEANCPVAAILNPDSENTIGEGIVWTTDEGYRFKAKGEKHSRSAKRSGAPKNMSDPSLVSKDTQFVDTLVTEDRLCQGLEYLTEMGLDHSTRNTGEYIKWVNKDVLNEHKREIAEYCEANNTEWKKLGKIVNHTAREFYMRAEV